MESTPARQTREKVNPGMMGAELRPAQGPSRAHAANETKAAGYGLPCAECRAYYPADMQSCPICQSKQRVSPNAAAHVAPQTSAQTDQARLLAEERERLRELKSQIYASNSPVPAATFRCALDQNHNGNVEPAAVCHTCYSTVVQQAERMLVALHMNPRDGAQIVYEAVWADSSDPNLTYLNAANALLSELRRRAGIVLPPGTN